MQWGDDGRVLTGTAIGTGAGNTDLIIANLAIDDDFAAKVCADYSLTVGGVTYDDWFLPSKDELDLMYDNLKVNALGGFSGDDSGDSYWSSSEYYEFKARSQEFSDGSQSANFYRFIEKRVRPVRIF